MKATHEIDTSLQIFENIAALRNALARPDITIQVDNLEHKVSANIGAKQWSQLRSLLLNAREDRLDLTKFIEKHGVSIPSYVGKNLPNPWLDIAWNIYSWSGSSRRIYQVNKDLHDLISVTRLNGLRWSDIRLPFQTFYVSFEEAVEMSITGRLDDLLPFSCAGMWVRQGHFPGINGPLDHLSFCLIPTSIRQHRPYSRHAMESWMQAKPEHLPLGLFREVTSYPLCPIGGSWYFPPGDETDLVTGDGWERNESLIKRSWHLPPVSTVSRAWIGNAFRFIAGLCLYLKNLPASTRADTSWKPIVHRGRPDPKAITDGAQVCAVGCEFQVPKELRDAVREHLRRSNPLSEVCAHWRSGHWRRPPGKGGDDSAEKTVWVSPSLVNEHRLADGQLPSGSIAKLLAIHPGIGWLRPRNDTCPSVFFFLQR